MRNSKIEQIYVRTHTASKMETAKTKQTIFNCNCFSILIRIFLLFAVGNSWAHYRRYKIKSFDGQYRIV